MEVHDGSRGKKRPKRKNKNNRFMHNAKGFAKKGIFGRGTHIADDQYSYFINILDALKSGCEDVEEKVNMANNVFDQTVDQEEHLASNQIVSKALESLLGFIDADKLERFIHVFSKNLRPICSDRFASHVLQKMIEIAFMRVVGEQTTPKQDEIENDAEEKPSKRAKFENNKKHQTQSMEVSYNLSTKFTPSHRQECSDFVLRVSKFLLNNLEDFVWDRCANHLIRTAILCLVGVHIPKVAFEKATGVQIALEARKRYKVPDEWEITMQEYAQRLEMWPHFVNFPYEELTSALTSTICIALKAVNKNMLKHFGRRLLLEAFLQTPNTDDKKNIEIFDDHDNGNNVKIENENNTIIEQQNDHVQVNMNNLPMVFQHQSSVMLLETLLCIAGPKLFTQLYAMLFSTRAADLALATQTNFAVQRLLEHITERKDFEQVFDELQPHIEDMLKIGHTGVVLALTQTCLRLSAKQAPLLVVLQQAMHTTGFTEDKSHFFVLCLIKLKPYDVVCKELNDLSASSTGTTYVHLHGSLILQHTLQFNKPIFMVNSLLNMPPDQLSALLNTPNGSHIADAFMSSKFIGEKSRERFIRRLDGFFVDLAVTKFGSRVVEACYAAALDPQKAHIVKQLVEKVNMLRGSPFGRVLFVKFRIETYCLSVAQWRESLKTQQTKNKAQELFKDIIK